MMFVFISVLYAQQIPYGLPNYFKIVEEKPFKKITIKVPNRFDSNLFDSVDPINLNDKNLFFLQLIFDEEYPLHFILRGTDFKESSILYFIDLDNGGWIGPYAKSSFGEKNEVISGRLMSKNILIELSISDTSSPRNHLFAAIHPKTFIINDSKPLSNNRLPRQGNNKILVAGYWPPSNEGVRIFSQNQMLNPNGWMGENWENRGFDIVSYFPSFTDPDCESCGQGYGDLEVDYQDTSEDWWNIVDSINPIAIITFSRGFIDYSWELEWQYFNYFYWNADFTDPFYPTPTPPDSTVPVLTRRYSTLPMDSIVSKIASSDLGLVPYIDYTQGAGAYLSEFMGYHGVWHKSIMDSINNPCVVAGHVHVGGLIDWDTARQAAEITLREVIKVVNEYQSLPGDINLDGVISILDMLKIIGYLIDNINLNENELTRADLNYDSSVDVFDLMLLSNIILDW